MPLLYLVLESKQSHGCMEVAYRLTRLEFRWHRARRKRFGDVHINMPISGLHRLSTAIECIQLLTIILA